MLSRSWPMGMVVLVLLAFVPTESTAWQGSDVATIQSNPPGANVYLAGRLIGVTPVNYPVPCDEVVDTPYRIEYMDCAPVEGTLSARVAPGRVVGMVFSFGITAGFQCPHYFVPVAVDLTGGSCGAPSRTIPPASGPFHEGDGLAARLRTLKDLHDRGVLSDAEYERERENALGGL